MTDAVNIRALALEILLEVTEEGKYSHLVLRSVLEKYQYLEKKERAFLTRMTEGTIQHMIELDYIIDQFSKVKTAKQKPVIRGILRLSVYQLKYMDSVPASAACNEAVKLARKKGFASLSGFVNGVLRNISRNIEQIAYPDETNNLPYALSVRYSMPEWIVNQWLESYGEEKTREMLEAFLSETPLTIRTNLEKTTPEKLEKTLKEEGVEVKALDRAEYPELPYALTISGFDHLNGLKSFQEGLFYVQDISSMLVAEWAQPQKGDYCIDVCAAPGGKSIHLAEKLQKTGMVEARDLTEYKVEQIRSNIARCGLGNIRAVQQDATVKDDNSLGKADVLLADLPCSGLGILRKKTDIKYKMSKKQQDELVALQRQILDTVCTYVKDTGTLVYSTCTIHKAENEENVQWFLQKHPEFELERMKQIFPQQALGDGFFIAKLRRVSGR
jgi:16S rRNA (cytosine967-C5)-methyltransferase